MDSYDGAAHILERLHRLVRVRGLYDRGLTAFGSIIGAPAGSRYQSENDQEDAQSHSPTAVLA